MQAGIEEARSADDSEKEKEKKKAEAQESKKREARRFRKGNLFISGEVK